MRQLFDFNHLPVITMDVTGAARFGLQTLFHSLQVAGSTVSEIHHWTDPSVHESPVLMIGTTRDRRIALLLESASLTAGPEPESYDHTTGQHAGTASLYWCSAEPMKPG